MASIYNHHFMSLSACFSMQMKCESRQLVYYFSPTVLLSGFACRDREVSPGHTRPCSEACVKSPLQWNLVECLIWYISLFMLHCIQGTQHWNWIDCMSLLLKIVWVVDTQFSKWCALSAICLYSPRSHWPGVRHLHPRVLKHTHGSQILISHPSFFHNCFQQNTGLHAYSSVYYGLLHQLE